VPQAVKPWQDSAVDEEIEGWVWMSFSVRRRRLDGAEVRRAAGGRWEAWNALRGLVASGDDGTPVTFGSVAEAAAAVDRGDFESGPLGLVRRFED
jgi:hypothetical protein